jgi:hypothetical protein
MPLISSDQIRDISVKSVESFLNDKIPLSQGLAKQAAAYEMNSEQIHRAVEATNSIAYLKVLEMSADRTVEFPLCKYAEVMRAVALPEDFSMSKIATAARIAAPLQEDGRLPLNSQEEACKMAKDLVAAEQQVYFLKMASENALQLEQLKDRSITIVPELFKAAGVIKADPQGLEKLAAAFEGRDLALLTKLVYGEVINQSNTGIFKEAELQSVKKVQALVKEAQEVSAGIKEKEELQTRANLVKQAGIASIIGKGVQMFGTGIGKTISTPVSAVAKTMGQAIKNTSSNMVNKVLPTTNKIREGLGKIPLSPTAKKVGVGAVLGTGLLAATDAAVYSPGKNKDTGGSRDAWDTLQRQN